MTQLTQTAIWSEIIKSSQSLKSQHLRDLFASNPHRFEQMSMYVGEVFLDYSRQCLTPQTIELLASCLEQQDFTKKRAGLFAGDKVNASEGRAALHIALRSSDSKTPNYKEIKAERERALEFAEKLRAKAVIGASGKAIKNIIHIGIGGSDLGPQHLVTALGDELSPHIVFIRNVDAAPIANAMAQLNPHETMVFVASKTFTTAETMLNANTVLGWLSDALGKDKALQHVVALTAAPDKAKAHGVDEARIFRFWDWVGGRFSVWSSIGLPAMAAMGRKKFIEFLRGGEAMDNHFYDAPLLVNMPVVLAMLSVWNINVLGYQARAVLPYSEALREWPSYLQQLEMESLGKSVDKDGKAISYSTAPVVFGMTGTPAQHAFMQALHQGTQIIPAEIIMVKAGHPKLPGHHAMLNANGLAQAEALQQGKQTDDLQKSFSGNRPSSILVLDRLSPFAVGELLALYEHKVFTESVFWNLNPFDQWGVELGKTLATPIQNALETDAAPNGAAAGLIKRLRNL
ncbi:MAG: glucose-6-phosphate isomerase [Alphaproteobacteria bacterium]|nr:glucose-6-phosphate isomerase [Alphaproteobacteria bacterium]